MNNNRLCELCGERPIDMEFHSLAFGGLIQAGICLECWKVPDNDRMVLNAIISSRWNKIKQAIGISEKEVQQQIKVKALFSDRLRFLMLRFIWTGEPSLLDKLETIGIEWGGEPDEIRSGLP